MKKILLELLLIQILFVFVLNEEEVLIKIQKSRSHSDQTNDLTPLVVSVSSEDKDTKANGVYLICVVDVSGSMYGSKISLVKESLNYLVDKVMTEQDYFSLIKFSDTATLVNGFYQMTRTNKNTVLNYIRNLNAYGGTNIYAGLQRALNLITQDFETNGKIVSMILLSDGYDLKTNADVNFRNLLSSTGKNKIPFTLHTFGYGASHDADLMYKISLVKDGGYYFIKHFQKVKDSLLEVYGSLSTVYKLNAELIIQSNFVINKVYGQEDMYEASLTKVTPYTFKVKIINFFYGKTYNYVALVDIPSNTEFGTEVLKATILPFNKDAYYYWDLQNTNSAYEEYIRGITCTYFTNAYNTYKSKGIENGKVILKTGSDWIKTNYSGKRAGYDCIKSWGEEFEDALTDFNNFRSYGIPNFLSKLRELKTLKSGSNYMDENSYQRKIIDDSYNIDISSYSVNRISGNKIMKMETNRNFYYFYLKSGTGDINGLHFSEERSTIFYYSDNQNDQIKITPKSILEYYYWSEKVVRIQTKIDFSRGGKFIYKRDFPFDFCTKIDGKKDITFTIQFLSFEYRANTDISNHLFEIKAFILNEQEVNTLRNNANISPNSAAYDGYYDKGFRVGKFIIQKETIAQHLNSNYNNYLYIIVQKAGDIDITYTNVIGQFSFVPMDYIFSVIPENFYIFSNLFPDQDNPHLYTLKMEPTLNKNLRIEFATANELDCKILNYQIYSPGSEEFYSDSENLNITRTKYMGKTYIDVFQSDKNETKFKNIILSIFSTNGGNIPGKDEDKLRYTLRYSTYSDYGIYQFNDINETEGIIDLKRNEIDQRNITINFYALTTKKIEEVQYTPENTRFILKIFTSNKKKRQKVYETISLFQKTEPDLYFEKNVSYKDSNGDFDFQVDTNKNYFITLYTISNKNYEILSYKNSKISLIPTDIIIDDINNSYENEFNTEVKLDIIISDNITYNYLEIKISDFDDGKYGTLHARIEGTDLVYKSNQPSNNIILITKEKCEGMKINLEIKLKDGKNTNYFLSIKLVNKIEINPGENFFFEMLEEYNGQMEITINNINENKNRINIFAKSNTGNFSIKQCGQSLEKCNIFGSQSINIMQDMPILLEISSNTGEFISLYTHIVKNAKKRKISNSEISLYGYLKETDDIDCIYFNDDNADIEKYQVRILGDKQISIKYNHDTNFEYTEDGMLYVKEFSKTNLEKICLKSKNELDSVFFGMQIVDISNQKVSNVILQPTIFGAFYSDTLYKNEIRYYRQGLFDPNQKEDLRYLYNVRQISGEIKVYISLCDNFPYCKYSKEDLENNDNIKSLYNINEYFFYSKKSTNFVKYDPEKIPVYIILCLSDSCEYTFILNKNTAIIDLTQTEKYSSMIYKNNIDKFSILPKNKNTEIVSITLYTHSGEVMLNTNCHCEEIKHTIFGNMEKLEIPKSCDIQHSFEIYVLGNMDSVYSLEYLENNDIKYKKIKSNIVQIENIYKDKLIEFTPNKSSYFIKFIPINCEISIKYGNNKMIPSQQNIYYYNSNDETEKYYNFTVHTEQEDCMIYTYLEELTEVFYGILSDQVPYYISLNKFNKNYKLIYPIPNGEYDPMFKINFFEETPIKINQRVENEKDEEINAIFTKDFKPNLNVLKKCEKDEICYLILEIIYELEPENPIILEIIPKSSNKVPGVLIDNKIKQDFTTIYHTGQKYISKILKDEEGEIYFNYKYFSGELIGKIIPIDKKSWKNKYDLPAQNEYLKYDNMKQKIVFNKKETNRCDNGCYLFIEVLNLESFKDENDQKDLYMDYSIFLKKYDNTTQLRLNEVIIGTLEKTINESYIEFYSIQIPYSTSELYIDYSSENTNIIINSGNIKPTIEKSDYSFESNGKDQIFIINNNMQNSDMDLKGKNYIIGIYTKQLKNGYSQYSFRIRAENKMIKNYTYTDMNTESICETKQNNDFCYFLIPIINKQENASLFLYAMSTSISDELIISYKKIRIHEQIIDGEYIDDDIYNITSKNDFVQNMLIISNSELNMDENENILIKIEVPVKGIVTLLHSFKTNLRETLVNPKNKILFSLNKDEELNLNIPNGAKSLVHINVINGKAKGGYQNDDTIQEITGKYSSMYLQAVENNDNKKIIIKTDFDDSVYFYTYMKISSIKRNINDIGIGSAKLRTGEGFPIEFYSKISENNDYIINFNIENINEIEDKNKGISIFNIKGYIVPEEIIEQLKLDDTMVYSGTPFIGKYETGFGVSKLVLYKENIEKYYAKNKNNYIYLIIEDSYENPTIINDIKGVITILQNNNLDYVAPNNVYINGNLEPNKNSINKYKLSKKNSNDTKIRVEFSSSSENVKYKIYYYNDNYTTENNAQVKVNYETKEALGKQNIDIYLEDNFDSLIFEVYADKIENDKDKLSYTLRYRTDEGKTLFKNYKINGIVGVKEEKKDKKNNFILNIPSIQNSDTSENIPAHYYLKIYKKLDNVLFINNTISVIDGVKPYKSYEFSIKEQSIEKTIEIPDDSDEYYAVITAITPDKELLCYNSFMINEKTRIWIIILIIILVILLLIALFIIIRCLLRKRRNNIEDNDIGILPLEKENNLEEKINE